MSLRNSKLRQSRRLHYMQLQEQAALELEADRLRDQNDQAAATLGNQLATFEAPNPNDAKREVGR